MNYMKNQSHYACEMRDWCSNDYYIYYCDYNSYFQYAYCEA